MTPVLFRCLPLLRKGVDVGVVPADHEATREFAEFCKEVLSLGEEQIVYGDNTFFVDSPGSGTTGMATAIGEAMDALTNKSFAPLSRENSGNVVRSPSSGPSKTTWNLVPFKRTTELHMLEV